jgi:hypothetical protein
MGLEPKVGDQAVRSMTDDLMKSWYGVSRLMENLRREQGKASLA